MESISFILQFKNSRRCNKLGGVVWWCFPYRISIKKKDQPLLIAETNNKGQANDIVIYLVSEVVSPINHNKILSEKYDSDQKLKAYQTLNEIKSFYYYSK